MAIASVMLIVGLFGVGSVNRLLQTQAQDELFRQAEATGRLVEAALADVGDNPGAGFEGRLRGVRSEAARVLDRARVVGGHDVVEAVNGEQGILRAAEREFDTIFVDLKLPDMDGLDLACRLGGDCPRR